MDKVEILVKGHLDLSWSDWLGGLEIAHLDQDRSRLAGSLVDQAMLHGILARLRDLDLKILSFQLYEGVDHEQ